MSTGQSAASESEQEQFVFHGTVLNISAIRADIATGKLKPKSFPLKRDFIEEFATRVHGLDLAAPQATKTSMWSGVRAVDVHKVPDEAFNEPVIFAHLGKNKGLLDCDGDGVNYVLADGNKRLGKAFFTGRESLDGCILSRAQTRKYIV